MQHSSTFQGNLTPLQTAAVLALPIKSATFTRSKSLETSSQSKPMNTHNKINYVEFPVRDFTASKAFFAAVFDWEFTDYGPDYCAFSNAGIDGGFFKSTQSSTCEQGSALIVFYSADLEGTQHAIEQAGGTINQAIFSFPGGRRFHFLEPSGNEMAVWTDILA